MVKALNYQSVLIVTYGRTGSTLLQGILNSIDGCLVRGENNQFCYGLFEAYKNILDIKKHYAPTATNPFYGAHLLDENMFLDYSSQMVKKLILADKDKSEISCYGFKEVRYINILDNLFEYLDFLKKIFPNAAFVFNTRKMEDVLKSGWWPERNQTETINNMIRCEKMFTSYQQDHANSFLITYEDVTNKSPKLASLFDFLGAPYLEGKIDTVLATPHSYSPRQT